MKRGLIIVAAILSLDLAYVIGRHDSAERRVAAQIALVEAADRGKVSSETEAVPNVQPLTAELGNLLKIADAEPDVDDRSELLTQGINSLVDKDEAGALDSLKTEQSQAAFELRQALIRHWAERAPAAAAQWACRLADPSEIKAAISIVANTWANNDVRAALKWVASLPEGQVKQDAVMNVAYEAARSEPVAAIEVTAALQPSIERDRLLTHALAQWAGIDSHAALAWAGSVSDGDLRQQLIGVTLVAGAPQNFAAAAQQASSVLKPGEIQERVILSIAQRWAQAEPTEALDWISRSPDNRIRQTAVDIIAPMLKVKDSSNDAKGQGKTAKL